MSTRIPIRTAAHEGVFNRLGLTDSNVQSEQGGGDGIGPFMKAQIAHGIEQDRAGEEPLNAARR